MAVARKVIVSCAITGSIHTPSMSEHLPVTQKQIAASAIEAAEAGASIVHLHARDPSTGRPDSNPTLFGDILSEIKKHVNCVINITTGGSMTMTLEQRLQPVSVFRPELASLNMGTMNFGLYPMLRAGTEYKHGWEREHLEKSKEGIFRNTFLDIERIIGICSEYGTRFEFECYDIGHIYTLAHFADRGLVEPPFFIQGVFGILGGIGAHPQDVAYMKATADRLFGDKYRWSALGSGRNQMTIAALSSAIGGNVRVGLEDSLWLRPGVLATSNASQVQQVRSIIQGLGCEIASPDETREILQLKGADSVAF